MDADITRTSGIKAKDKIGYALGDLASCLLFGLSQSVLNKYCTDILEISVINVMVMTVIARIWDAVNDPIWGRIIDGAERKPDGRYRRWLRIFSLPAALAAVLMFTDVRSFSPSGRLAWISFAYILFGMLYTCVNIPYGSLAQVITSDSVERSSLSVFRSVGSTLGSVPAMILASVCYVSVEGGREMSAGRVFTGVCIIAFFSVIFFMLCFRMTTERVVSIPAPREKGRTARVVRTLLKSRPFVTVSLASMLFLAAQMFGQGYNSYLFHHYFQKPGLTMIPTLCQYLPAAMVMLFATKLGKKYGRREICSAGVLLAAASYAALFLLSLAGIRGVWVYLLTNLLAGIGTSFIFLLVWALTGDAIEYDRVRFGINDEATSYAFYTFMRKLGQTAATVLINLPLLRIGYSGSELKTEGLSGAALKTMYDYSAAIPALLFLLVFILLRLCPLSRKAMEDL
ncbi:MAG: MFS transporter, partial [Firmicutes bacterium]|nr:MFS transporter [Bacillota bacterium]